MNKLNQELTEAIDALQDYEKLEVLNYIQEMAALSAGEKWRDVEGYEGLYQVSDLGRVKSLQRTLVRSDGVQSRVSGKILSQRISTAGYPQVTLNKGDGGGTKMVHRLVCAAFHKKESGKNHVNHINGVKVDNRASNLEWCTPSHNLQHAVDIGLNIPLKGEERPNSKLTGEDVKKMRRMRKEAPKLSYAKIGKYFGVSDVVARRIIKKELWRHI